MKPPITEREVSLHTAQAGISARATASSTGGDPAQISAMGRAAAAQPAQMREHITTLGGLGMHVITLPVRQAAQAAQETDVEPFPALTAARMAACFHDPLQVYEILTQGGGLAEMDAFCLQLTLLWTEKDIAEFGSFISQQKARSPSLQPEPEEATPGKSRRPRRGARAKR